MNGTNKKILVRTINDICYQSQIAKNAVWLFVYFLNCLLKRSESRLLFVRK